MEEVLEILVNNLLEDKLVKITNNSKEYKSTEENEKRIYNKLKKSCKKYRNSRKNI